MSVQQEVLHAVRRICRERGAWTFTPDEIVRALPNLNASTVRTHIVSRCCVNAPAHHAHRWGYFRRVSRGLYQVMRRYRAGTRAAGGTRRVRNRATKAPVGRAPATRDAVHAFIVKEGDWYIADCVEVAVVTQGRTLDEAIANLREAVTLHLDGEEAAMLGIVPHPRLIVTIEIRAADAAA